LLAGVPEERIFCAPSEFDSIDLVKTDLVDSVYILYDTSTYTLSCQMKDKLIKKLGAAQ
jgi:Leu/Phe-tRNA-protein transferase